MDRIFIEENNVYQIDFTNALWATNKLNDIISDSNTILSDVDFIAETDDKILAKEFVKRMVLAWDSDYTRVTPEERKQIEIAEKEMENGEFYTQEEVLKTLGITL